MNNSNDDESPHEKEQNKVADFCIGAILLGSIIFIIALYAGWVSGVEDYFGGLGCAVTGYFLNLWVIKPFLQKRGRY